ncbi:MAG: ribosomal protein S5 domain 2-type protein [Monoraphidium minutum]|nr:MAG: ribosomal protein S5 domain 2-type protein [Monoraphidium minutum]
MVMGLLSFVFNRTRGAQEGQEQQQQPQVQQQDGRKSSGGGRWSAAGALRSRWSGAGGARAGGGGAAGVPVVSRVHARVGLLGNPSDGFYGKTISLSLDNFYAEVTLTPRPPGSGIEFLPHPLHDRLAFGGMAELYARVEGEGYYGGIRLLMAACKRFYEDLGNNRGVVLPEGLGSFALSYDTNIPRQAGLSGSSAIACATLNCLFAHYGIPLETVPLAERPNLVLSVEQELGIAAGLQDRVIQVYGGLVYMDFERAGFKKRGHGEYHRLPPALLPRLWLVYCDNPSDSGRAHSDVKRRWQEGDPVIREKMELVAACAEEGSLALVKGDHGKLAQLMDRNFDLRREMYGDAALGKLNLRMVAAARSVGAAAKFTGSGGAVVALCPQGEGQEALLKDICAAEGFVIEEIRVAPPTNEQG